MTALKAIIRTGALPFILLGCVGGTDKPDSMDMALDQQAPKQTEFKLSGDGVEWQKFFQPPPDLQARHKLTKTAAQWSQSSDPDQLLMAARQQLVLGQIVDAENTLRTALRIAPNHREALIEAASTATRRKKFEDAYNYLAKIRKIIAADQRLNSQYVFRYRYVLGLAELGRGNRSEGIRILSDLIRLDKTFSPGYAALAAQYLHEGKVEAAEFIARRGIDRGKPLASLHNSLGVVAKKKGDLAKARAHFETALKQAESYSPAIVNLAIVAILLQEYENAELNLNRAADLSPYNPDVYVTLGVLHNKTGRLDAAKTAFRRALEIEPEHAGARFNLGALVAREDHHESEALRLFHEVTLLPNASSDMKRLAGLYMESLQRQIADGPEVRGLKSVL